MQNHKGREIMWSHVCLYSFSGVVIVLEKVALVLCFLHYLWMEKDILAWLTLGLCLPAIAVQLLSLKWYTTDTEKHKPSIIFVHCLHLGIYRRLWQCMKSQRGKVDSGAWLIKQADVSALCLIESLSLSLPQSLLQTYSVFTLHTGFLTPVTLCVGLSLLNVSWFLALYSRSCLLLRPGHLHMTPAAMLCQLIWRGGMLGARVASLMFFCSIFHWWACGVIGFHWLIMTFWLVSQQTEICVNLSSWRFFNLVLGAIHIFLFFNVKDGPSRYRMVGFYLLMLLENTFLLLLASDSLSEPSWNSISFPVAVLCSFFIGVIFVVLHYRFLHPKSTEILQSLRLQMSMTAIERTASDLQGREITLESCTNGCGTFSVTGFAPDKHEEACSTQPLEDCGHHHHMLLYLALKTGTPGKIDHLCQALSVLPGNDNVTDANSGLKGCNQLPLVVNEHSESLSDHAVENRGDAEHVERLAGAELKESQDGESKMLKDAVYNTCPVDGSSTVYFSAEPHSSYSVDDGPSDKENMTIISPIVTGGARHLTAQELLNRNPCFTSTPIPDLKTMHNTSPRLGGVRRQVLF
ncbi:XK-related protein 5b [Triplophysa dalaica]|uniref:XK-related protein 5b n=1 Tax=Triplophysa dalaica TaxID=1582913 RepID=UPI0024DFB00F|nr:XK-related protein 5b [Triplophysa dalaica]